MISPPGLLAVLHQHLTKFAGTLRAAVTSSVRGRWRVRALAELFAVLEVRRELGVNGRMSPPPPLNAAR
jgi:hypothetical protein